VATDDITKAEILVRGALHRPLAHESEAVNLLVRQAGAAVNALSLSERRFLDSRCRAVLRGGPLAFTPETAKLVSRLLEATAPRRLSRPRTERSAKL
jgi:hypothetical protein